MIYQVADPKIPTCPQVQFMPISAEISLKCIVGQMMVSNRGKSVSNKISKEAHNKWKDLLLHYHNSQFMTNNLEIVRYGSIIKEKKVNGLI